MPDGRISDICELIRQSGHNAVRRRANELISACNIPAIVNCALLFAAGAPADYVLLPGGLGSAFLFVGGPAR